MTVDSSSMPRFWRRIAGSRRAKTFLVVVVGIAVLVGALQWDSLTGEEQPASTWKSPEGYTVRSSVGVGESSVRLWVRDQSAAICFVQEEVDVDGRHQSAVSGSCWDATDVDWRSARGMGTFVIAPPGAEGASVVLISSDGTRVGPVPVRGGLAMVRDSWLPEAVDLEVQALDANGKELEPTGTLHFEAA
ncbi:hypothetical protein [Paractinoplanes lichenicola]|uniref:Uncharacterized protein n=1 Tax=Paractinoplanes lichenicola TaxID=2802976 RepID=A0ABS1VSA3_9ACTN|nr:hypothetical protein [Actinoplanes lichenicola]MBL7257511.1 hypothetical protein [Actinoplanes lichenicola]